MRSLKQAAIGSVAGSASLSTSGPFAASLVTGPLRESFASTGFFTVVGLSAAVLGLSIVLDLSALIYYLLSGLSYKPLPSVRSTESGLRDAVLATLTTFTFLALASASVIDD